MDKDTLRRLERLNQLQLTEEEKTTLTAYFEMQAAELEKLNQVDTSAVERMVHVMPLQNVLREDVVNKQFTRDQLQEAAPDSMDGYWQVPRLVE